MLKIYSNSLFVGIVLLLSTSCFSQKTKQQQTVSSTARQVNLSDSALLDIVQQQTFKYFWNFAHPVSGMAKERSNVAYNYGEEVTTTGGTGFGVMATIVATERKWISRDTASKRMLKGIVLPVAPFNQCGNTP